MHDAAIVLGCAPCLASVWHCPTVPTSSPELLALRSRLSRLAKMSIPFAVSSSPPVVVDLHHRDAGDHITARTPCAVYDSAIRAWRHRAAFEDPLYIAEPLQ